jgi:tripartite ATP-independent transporter DctM subunit
MALTVLVACFLILLIIGFPIAFCLLGGSILYLVIQGYPLTLITQRMFEGMNGFPLLAVPFFVLTGQLMLKGRLLGRMCEFANALIGHIRGGLAMINIVVSLFLGSIIGLAVADAASLGSFLIPMMKDEGYEPSFASAVTASSALLGPIMPPSVLMILYAIAVGKTSIAGIFLGAIIPAFMICGAQIVVTYIISFRRGYPKHPRANWVQKWKAFKGAVLALFLPVIILGGIFGRVFTVTEASAMAALYALIVGFVIHRDIRIRDLPEIITETALTTGLVLILAGASTVTAWIIANEQVISRLAEPLGQLPVVVFLLLINIFLLLNGCFMDDYASVIIIGPILAPIAWTFGIDPIHIGIIICINLVIGLSTPPFGIVLFVTSPIAKVKLEETVSAAIPLILVSIAVLLLVTYVPSICLFLPRLFGY